MQLMKMIDKEERQRQSNIRIIGIHQVDTEIYLFSRDKIHVSSPEMKEELNLQIEKTYQIPGRFVSKQLISKHILVKFLILKTRERMILAVTYKEGEGS